jgi:hypothetical protein
MIDFYPVLARAVRDLPDPNAEARRGVFSRAVEALSDVHGLSDDLLSRFLSALHEAYVRLECEYLAACPAGQPA